MDPDQFYAWLDTLSPEEQEEALYEFEYMGANQVPGQYGMGGMAPQLGYSDFDLGMYSQLPPPMDKKGNILPYGQDQMTKGLNQLQDIGATTVDPALALYGGISAFSPDAFQPTRRPIGQPLDMSDQRYLQGLAAGGGASFDSYLAQKIMGTPDKPGMTPAAALADLWNFINMGGEDEVDPKKAAARQALIASIPQNLRGTDPTLGRQAQGKVGDYSSPQGLAASFDMQAVQDMANDLYERKSKIPEAGYIDETTGLPYAGYEEEPSFLSEKYRAAGIPSPEATYMDEEYVGAWPTEDMLARDEREAAAQDKYAAAIKGVKTADTNASALEREWSDYLAAKEKGVQRGTDAVNPYGLPENLLNAASKRGVDQWDTASRPMPDMVQPGLSPQLLGIKPQPRQLNQDYMDPRLPAGSQQSYREAEQLKAAEELLNTAPSVRVNTKTGAASPVYDFGGTMQENAAADRGLDVIQDLIPFGGGNGREIRSMNRGTVQNARNQTRTAREARNKALQNQIAAHEKTTPGELAGMERAAQGWALARSGRTPTNDVLMQRAMARAMLMGR